MPQPILFDDKRRTTPEQPDRPSCVDIASLAASLMTCYMLAIALMHEYFAWRRILRAQDDRSYW